MTIKLTKAQEDVLLAVYRQEVKGEAWRKYNTSSTTIEKLSSLQLIVAKDGNTGRWTQQFKLTDAGRERAQALYLAHYGIGDFFAALSTYVKKQTNYTGMMDLLKALPSMLATEQFAHDLPDISITVHGNPRKPDYAWKGIYVTVQREGFISEGAHYVIKLNPIRDNRLSFDVADNMAIELQIAARLYIRFKDAVPSV